MPKIKDGWKTFWIILGTIIFMDMVVYHSTEIVVPPPDYKYPPSDPNRVVRDYDLSKSTWRYKDIILSPANDSRSYYEMKTDILMQEYLEKKIKGYKSSTYWGEEYWHIDPEDRDEYDRIDYEDINNEYR